MIGIGSDLTAGKMPALRTRYSHSEMAMMKTVAKMIAVTLALMVLTTGCVYNVRRVVDEGHEVRVVGVMGVPVYISYQPRNPVQQVLEDLGR